MAKKKDITAENVQASENEFEDIGNTKVRRGFPKESAKAKIKAITVEKDIIKVKFKDLVFSPGQEAQLVKWMNEDDELLVTISLYQAKI